MQSYGRTWGIDPGDVPYSTAARDWWWGSAAGSSNPPSGTGGVSYGPPPGYGAGGSGVDYWAQQMRNKDAAVKAGLIPYVPGLGGRYGGQFTPDQLRQQGYQDNQVQNPLDPYQGARYGTRFGPAVVPGGGGGPMGGRYPGPQPLFGPGGGSMGGQYPGPQPPIGPGGPSANLSGPIGNRGVNYAGGNEPAYFNSDDFPLPAVTASPGTPEYESQIAAFNQAYAKKDAARQQWKQTPGGQQYAAWLRQQPLAQGTGSNIGRSAPWNMPQGFSQQPGWDMNGPNGRALFGQGNFGQMQPGMQGSPWGGQGGQMSPFGGGFGPDVSQYMRALYGGPMGGMGQYGPPQTSMNQRMMGFEQPGKGGAMTQYGGPPASSSRNPSETDFGSNDSEYTRNALADVASGKDMNPEHFYQAWQRAQQNKYGYNGPDAVTLNYAGAPGNPWAGGRARLNRGDLATMTPEQRQDARQFRNDFNKRFRGGGGGWS